MSAQRLVCDASIGLAWLQGEDVPAWVSQLWEGFREAVVEVVVPSLFWLEVGNALSRRADLTDERALEGLLRLQALGFTTLDADQALLLRALQLARLHDLTTYDALYLALADAIHAPVATLDRALARAATRAGRSHPHTSRHRVSEDRARYAPDPVSLAALGARLAELRA